MGCGWTTCQDASSPVYVKPAASQPVLRFHGGEHKRTLLVAENYALTLLEGNRFEEAKVLMRKTLPAARRVFGKDASNTLKMRSVYAEALYRDPGATLDDVREAVTTLDDVERIVRRVLGSAHPHVSILEGHLRESRAALRARETNAAGGRVRHEENYAYLQGEGNEND